MGLHSPCMQTAIDLLVSELRSTHGSDAVECWYRSYLEKMPCPRSRFADVLSIVMPGTGSSDVLRSITMLFEGAQEAVDAMSLGTADHSYEQAMEIISAITVYSSVFPIIERHVEDKALGQRIADIYSDASMHLNAPRDGTCEALEGRRRFFFDFHLPVQVGLACVGRSLATMEKEEDFVRMYLAMRGGQREDKEAMQAFYEDVSCGVPEVQRALRLLFEKAYLEPEERRN